MRLFHDYYEREIGGDYLDKELLQEDCKKFVESFPKFEKLNVSYILLVTEDEGEGGLNGIEVGYRISVTEPRFFVRLSAPQGGTLGFLCHKKVLPSFAKVIFALEDSEFFEPLTTSSVSMLLRPWTGEFLSHQVTVWSKINARQNYLSSRI